MATLEAIFEATDHISNVLESMATAGETAMSQIEQAGNAGNAAFEQTAQAATTLSRAMESASQSTDYWTSAIGNYDKGAMEAIYSTEELVEMGYKTTDALSDQEAMFELCEQSAQQLTQAMEATTAIEEELNAAMEQSAEIAEEVANSDNVSAEAKEELARASEEAQAALEALTQAQEEAAAAMDAYDATMMSGTNDLDELEAAAERAGHAAENLAEANGRASQAAEELSSATSNAADELEKTGDKGMEAFEQISSALAAAGITAMLKEMAEAAYELADAFSEAEKTVVLATGATGDNLASLEDSMMNVYAAARSADLNATAGGIGEINTRLGLTGEALESTTTLFLDYANVTNQDVVGAVGNVTKVMNQWGVSVDNVEGLMDKLTYAGQMSGISVSSLSNTLVTNRAVLEQVGFGLDESIGLLANLELQGISSQTVMMGLRTAINHFSDEGQNASIALRSVVDEIASMGDESAATALAVDTFGSRAGVALAGSIRSGQLSIDDLASSLANAGGTLEATAAASQTLGEKWQQAGNKVRTAFTGAIEPATTKASTALANMTGKMGDFLNAHPKVTAALTAGAVGAGVFALGVTGVTAATTVAIPAITALGTAISGAMAALGPAGWAILGVTALTAGLVTLGAAIDDTSDRYENLTASSQRQYDEIQNLNAEYERTVSIYGEHSQEALTLQGRINYLQDEYERTKQTVEEFNNALQSISDRTKDNLQSYDEAISKVEDEGSGVLGLTARLEELAIANDGSNASQTEMLGIIEALNAELPGLNINLEDVINNTDNVIAAIEGRAMAEINANKASEAFDSYKEQLGIKMEAQQALTKATDDQTAAQERLSNAMGNERYQTYLSSMQAMVKASQGHGAANNGLATHYKDVIDAVNGAEAAVRTANDEVERAQEVYDEAANAAQELLNQYLEFSGITMEAAEGMGELDSVINSAAQEVMLLAVAYDEAYNSALASFSGQFGLFDTAQADMEATVSAAQAALDSQLAYWQDYASNIEVLKSVSAEDLGVTQANYDALMAYAQSGTEEAAGLAASMAEAINSGNADAVAALANTIGQVEAAQQQAAGQVAQWQTDFNSKMDSIVQKMQQSMQDLDVSAEASAAATSTMTAYTDSITTGGSSAVAQAQSIAAQITAALSISPTINIGVSGPGAQYVKGGYALGTESAIPGWHLVGENGPEIIAFAGGETVYNAEETERMLGDPYSTMSLPPLPERTRETHDFESKDRRIVIAVEGGGEIKVSGSGADNDAIVDMISENIRPVLIQILEEEIYEEGERSRDF